jgi:rhomboid protease GluP
LNFLSPSIDSLFLFGGSGAAPRFHLRPLVDGSHGRLASCGNPAHLVQYDGSRQLAPPTSEMYGPSRMVIIYTLAGIAGFTASSVVGRFLPFLGGASFTVGASAPLCGLLGALMYYGKAIG